MCTRAVTRNAKLINIQLTTGSSYKYVRCGNDDGLDVQVWHRHCAGGQSTLAPEYMCIRPAGNLVVKAVCNTNVAGILNIDILYAISGALIGNIMCEAVDTIGAFKRSIHRMLLEEGKATRSTFIVLDDMPKPVVRLNSYFRQTAVKKVKVKPMKIVKKPAKYIK